MAKRPRSPAQVREEAPVRQAGVAPAAHGNDSLRGLTCATYTADPGERWSRAAELAASKVAAQYGALRKIMEQVDQSQLPEEARDEFRRFDLVVLTRYSAAQLVLYGHMTDMPADFKPTVWSDQCVGMSRFYKRLPTWRDRPRASSAT